VVWGSGPKPWTLDIQPQPAEPFDRVIQAEAAALEQLECVVDAFDEATGIPALEIVENPVLPVMHSVEELIKTGDARRFSLFGPELKASLGGGPIPGLWSKIAVSRVRST
jgi:hypothetical protein